MRKNRAPWTVTCGIGVVCLLFIITGCTPESGNTQLADIAEESMERALSLEAPDGAYGDVAWVDEDLFAFLYASAASAGSGNYDIALYRPGTQDWKILPLPKREECIGYTVFFLTRLPNAKLGFIFNCDVYHDHVTGAISSLYMWDDETNTLHELQRYPENFVGGSFAFAPDMSQLVQDTWTGPGADQLYRITEGGQMERLLSDYQQVSSPAWSPDGQTIAFMGLKTYPGTVESVNDVGNLLRYPVDLYLMDSDGKNLHVLLPGIGMGGGTNWSPQSQLLSFGGEYHGLVGLWVLNTSTLQTTRFWSHPAAHDWSPDGKHIVVIQKTNRSSVEVTEPVIIDLPSDLYDTAK